MSNEIRSEEEILEDILEGMYLGESVRGMSAKNGVSDSWFWKRLDKSEELQKRYARARIAQGENHAARLMSIVDQVKSGKLTPEQGRVMADVLKWTASKLHHKAFGDRIEQSVTLGVTDGLAAVLDRVRTKRVQSVDTSAGAIDTSAKELNP